MLKHDKCHLFDVDFKKLKSRESSVFQPGEKIVIADTPLGKIGILIMGDFQHQWWDDDDDPTKAQIDAVVNLINLLKQRYSSLTKLGGHRDYETGNECPGDELYKHLPTMRQRTNLGTP